MRAHESFALDFPDASAGALWALVSDSNRTSRAAGLNGGTFRAESDEAGRPMLVGAARQWGFEIAWVSGPDSWVEGSWYRSVRRYLKGPAQAALIDYRLSDTAGGCRVQVERETTGRWPAIAFDVLVGRRRLRRYLHAAGAIARKARAAHAATLPGRQLTALLESQPTLQRVIGGPKSPTREPELLARLGRLSDADRARPALVKLTALLREGSDEALAQLSPHRLAEQWHLPRRDVLRTFLRATHAGLLDLHWGLRCRTCRVAATELESLAELPPEGHCPGCGATFGVDLSTHVEARFKVHRALRAVSQVTFCTGGAATRPHVFAQLVATPESPCEVRAPLPAEDLLLRALGTGEPQLLRAPHPAQLAVRVRGDRLEIERSGEVGPAVQIRVSCESGDRAVVLLERLGQDLGFVSGTELATVPEFQELFAGEAPRSRHEVSVGEITLLFSDLRGSTALYGRLGDARAFSLVEDHFDRLTEVIERCEGTLVKTIGDSVMAVFHTPQAALRAALEMQRALAPLEGDPRGLSLKLGLHTGSCLAVRANDRLDFFGQAVNLAARTESQSQGGEIVVTDALLQHPAIGALLAGLDCQPFEASLKGIAEPQRLWRLRPATAKATPLNT